MMIWHVVVSSVDCRDNFIAAGLKIIRVNIMIFALNGISHHTAKFESKVTAFNETMDEPSIYMAPPWKQKSMWWLLVC